MSREILKDLREQIEVAIKRVDFTRCTSAVLDDLENLRSACADYLEEAVEIDVGRH